MECVRIRAIHQITCICYTEKKGKSQDYAGCHGLLRYVGANHDC